MSRIGKKPIEVPGGVKVDVAGGNVSVQGPKGKLEQIIQEGTALVVEGNKVLVSALSNERHNRARQGLMRALVANMINGVHKGFERVLEISGVGYRAEVSGRKLTLLLGFSHPVVQTIPEGVDVAVEKNTKVIIRGIDRHLVGQVAASIRAIKVPDPYKIKGILYEGERIKKKAGKKAVT